MSYIDVKLFYNYLFACAASLTKRSSRALFKERENPQKPNDTLPSIFLSRNWLFDEVCTGRIARGGFIGVSHAVSAYLNEARRVKLEQQFEREPG